MEQNGMNGMEQDWMEWNFTEQKKDTYNNIQ